MTVTGDTQLSMPHRTAVLALALMQFLSSVSQAMTSFNGAWADLPSLDKKVLCISFVVSISPLGVLWLTRRSGTLLAWMAIPIVTIFLGTLHYILLFLGTGYLNPKGDWAEWLNNLWGLASAIVAVYAVGCAIFFRYRPSNRCN
jgi:hypothetical protein